MLIGGTDAPGTAVAGAGSAGTAVGGSDVASTAGGGSGVAGFMGVSGMGMQALRPRMPASKKVRMIKWRMNRSPSWIKDSLIR
jgi:hypothetical protein